MSDENENENEYIKPTEERDMRDLAALARGMVSLRRCPGGRYTPKDYVCMHCGIDFSGSSFCGQPLEDDGMTPFDASVARRIMQESEYQFERDE